MKNRRLNFNTLAQVENLCKELMGKSYFPTGTKQPVNLKERGWLFKWSNSKRAFGQCTGNIVNQNYIILSRELCSLNLKNRLKIEDTILHEIAHAIEFVNYGKLSHSSNWKYICQSIGGNGKRCYSSDEANVPKGKYTLSCPVCKHEVQRHRRPKNRTSCHKCDSRFNPKFILVVTQNH